MIEAIFSKTAAKAVRDRNISPGVWLRLQNPAIRITAHVYPPKPQLEIDQWELIRSTEGSPNLSSEPAIIGRKREVRERMVKYHTLKRHNLTSSAPTPMGSPQSESFRSQADLIPRILDPAVDSTDDEDAGLSQQHFCTQIAPALTRCSPSTLTSVCDAGKCGRRPSSRGNPLLSPEITGDATRSVDPCRTKVTEPEIARVVSNPTTSESDAAFRNIPFSVDEKIDAAAGSSVDSSTHIPFPAIEKPDNDRSSSIEVSELAANVPTSPQKLRTTASKAGPSSPTVVIANNTTTPPQIDASQRPLQRWRRQAQPGRYIPRFVAIIPRDQNELLNKLILSGDSWQPPLVGHPWVPGQVPATCLEQIWAAADDRAARHASAAHNAMLEVPSTRLFEPLPDQPMTQTSSSAATENSSAPDEEVAWSQSPPTQRCRRREVSITRSDHEDRSVSAESEQLSPSPPEHGGHTTGLPTSSPPVNSAGLRHIIRPPSRSSRPKMTVANGSNETPAASESVEEGSEIDGVDELGPKPPSRGSEISVDSTPSVAEIPRSVRSSHVISPVKKPPTGNLSPSTSKRANGTSAKIIQVAETPYHGKEPDPRLILNQQAHTRNVNGAGGHEQPSLTFVPATYISPNSGGNATVAATAESALMSMTSDTHVTSAVGLGLNCSAKIVDHSSASWQKSGELLRYQPDRKLARPRVSETASTAPSRSQRSSPALAETLPWGHMKDHESRLRPSHTLAIKHVKNSIEDALADTIETQDIKDDGPPAPNHKNPGSATDVSTAAQYVAVASAPGKRKRQGSDCCKSKRPQGSTQVVINDPDYQPLIEKWKQDRREIMQNMRGRKISIRRSTSSSLIDVNNRSNLQLSSSFNANRAEVPKSASKEALRQSSTPITRQSAYSGNAGGEDKLRLDDSSSMNRPDTAGIDNGIFASYQAAYADYGGNADDFRASYYFVLGVLNEDPNKIHSAHLDDAIFHHYHSYLPYRERAGSTAIGFVQFFNEKIEDPSHHKRIVRLLTHEELPSRRQSMRSPTSPVHVNQAQPSAQARSKAAMSACPTSSKKKDIDEKHKSFLKWAGPRGHLSQDHRESIEIWREDAARTMSPELGTPNIDRSVLHPSPQDGTMPVTIAASLLSKAGEGLQASAKPSTAPASKRTVHTSQRSISAAENAAHKRLQPSASPFVKPERRFTSAKTTKARSASTEALFSRAVTPSPARRTWTGTDTAFTLFEQNHAKLLVEKKRKAAAAKAGPGDTGTGINIFSWRKSE